MTARLVLGSRLRALGAHARMRAPAVVGALFVAAVPIAVSSRYPDRSEAGVATLLARATGGSVEPGDYVWEPSKGWLDDTFAGRKVLFLATTQRGAPRDLYRARVTLTRQGRPLRVRGVVRLTETALADESDLEASRSVAAITVRHEGRVESVALLELSVPSMTMGILEPTEGLADGAVSFVSFAHPPTSVRHELDERDLVLDVDGTSSRLAAGGAFVGAEGSAGAYGVGPFELHRTDERRAGVRGWLSSPTGTPESAPFSPPLRAPGAGAQAFPPNPTFTALAPFSGDAPVFRAEAAGGRLYAVDTRQLDLEIVAGNALPATVTGHRPSGLRADPRVPVLVIAGPSVPDAGARDRGVLVTPFADGALLLGDGSSPWIGRQLPSDASSVIGFSHLEAPVGAERAGLCVTGGGHVLFGATTNATARWPDDLFEGLDCITVFPIEGPAGAGMARFDAPDHVETIDSIGGWQWRAPSASSFLVFYRKDAGKSLRGLRGSEWKVDVAGQPDPPFAPAIRTMEIEELGVHVSMKLFASDRFQWVLRAGQREKTHRMGGQFEKSLSADDVGRAFFATGLAIGKRRNPLGLRIAGSTGHKFHGSGAILEMRGAKLSLGPSTGNDVEGDATELPLTAHGGVVLAAARERGPLQARADLCVLPDGSTVYAEAAFDSHEATATALVELGCQEVAALDRGAETAAWSETHGSIQATHDTTSLTALAASMRGSVLVR